MNEISVPMALIDLVPVGLFFAAAVLLQRDLYNKMVKGVFALLAAGSIMVLLAGLYKACWKMLYACGVCDYALLGDSLFLLQAPGFLLVFASLLALLTRRQTGEAAAFGACTAPAYRGSAPFLAAEVVGCLGVQCCLLVLALRMRMRSAAVWFAASLVCMLLMGWLSARFDDSAGMNWIAQAVNTAGNGALLAGVLCLHRAGLAEPGCLKKEART